MTAYTNTVFTFEATNLTTHQGEPITFEHVDRSRGTIINYKIHRDPCTYAYDRTFNPQPMRWTCDVLSAARRADGDWDTFCDILELTQ